MLVCAMRMSEHVGIYIMSDSRNSVLRQEVAGLSSSVPCVLNLCFFVVADLPLLTCLSLESSVL